MKEKPKIIIIGAGLAGLACAHRLHQAGHRPIVFEASDVAGGRVRTDEVDGFLLDHGFQVFLTAYPEAGKLLDLDSLNLRKFRAGALVRKGGKFHRLMDVFRHPEAAITSVMAPVGSLRDKLLVAKMRFQAKRSSPTVSHPPARKDQSTEQRLRDFGFSGPMIDGFFRAFYGGIFLERELRTSAGMFDFTFKMFTDGHAAVPALGMGQIPKQLAAKLPPGTIRYKSAVRSISEGVVELESGESHRAECIIIATDASSAAHLFPAAVQKPPRWRSTATLYFSAPATPLNEPIIALDGEGSSLINNVCVISDVAPHYAPPGRALISVSVLGEWQIPDLEGNVQAELINWFGKKATEWKHLRTYRIEKALPEQLPGERDEQSNFLQDGPVYVCGDHCTTASIEGAIVSGLNAAKAICRSVG